MNMLRNIALTLVVALGASTANASALSAARATESKNPGPIKRYLMTASKTIYAGSLVMIVNAGTAEPAAAVASNQGVVGVAIKTVTSAASGSYYVQVQEGWFKFAGDTLSQGDVGLPVYADDDQTVDETATTNAPCAGVLMEYVSASVGWVHVSLTYTARWASSADPITFTGDVTLSGGAGGATFTDSASSVVVADNDATALLIGSTGQLDLLTIDTGDDTETVLITGTTAVKAFDVGTGTASFAETVTMVAGATVGTTLTVTGLTTTNGGLTGSINAVTGVDSLLAADCGRITTVTAGIDTATLTLPEASTVLGCTMHVMYIGADAGALLDISPADGTDTIEGGCTLAASVVTMSGNAGADIGFTKATILTGDSLKLTAVANDVWILHSVQGICANN